MGLTYKFSCDIVTSITRFLLYKEHIHKNPEIYQIEKTAARGRLRSPAWRGLRKGYCGGSDALFHADKLHIGDAVELARYDVHLTIAEAAGNAVLCSYVADILSKTFIYMVLFERFFDFANNPSLDEHCRILEALRQRNEQRCIALTEEHVSLALVDLGIV